MVLQANLSDSCWHLERPQSEHRALPQLYCPSNRYTSYVLIGSCNGIVSMDHKQAGQCQCNSRHMYAIQDITIAYWHCTITIAVPPLYLHLALPFWPRHETLLVGMISSASQVCICFLLAHLKIMSFVLSVFTVVNSSSVLIELGDVMTLVLCYHLHFICNTCTSLQFSSAAYHYIHFWIHLCMVQAEYDCWQTS